MCYRHTRYVPARLSERTIVYWSPPTPIHWTSWFHGKSILCIQSFFNCNTLNEFIYILMVNLFYFKVFIEVKAWRWIWKDEWFYLAASIFVWCHGWESIVYKPVMKLKCWKYGWKNWHSRLIPTWMLRLELSECHNFNGGPHGYSWWKIAALCIKNILIMSWSIEFNMLCLECKCILFW